MNSAERNEFMKAVCVQFLYETNDFVEERAELTNFTELGVWLEGEEAVRAWIRQSDSTIRGSVETLEGQGWRTAPVFVAQCGTPGGRLSSRCYGSIRDVVKCHIASALPADALLMHLHGAACAEEIDDPEGDLLEMVRDEIGYQGRLILTLDLHANVTRKMAAHADAVTAYRTNPHTDIYLTGKRSAALAIKEGPFSIAVAKIAALIPPPAINHKLGHFRELLDLVDEEERSNNVYDISLLSVQPWLNIAESGLSVVVTGSESMTAGRIAMRLAEIWYGNRAQWKTGLMEWKEILGKLRQPRDTPWIIADTADATTGGAKGNSAALISRLLPHAESLKGPVLLQIVDPETYDNALNGDRKFILGSQRLPFDPDEVSLHEGRFRARGQSYHGVEFRTDGIALLRKGEFFVLVCNKATLGNTDPAFFESVGINPFRALAVQVKSFTGWKSGYSLDDGNGLYYDGEGVTSLRFESLPFNEEIRRLFPFQSDPQEAIKIWT